MRIGALELELTVDELETLIASGAIDHLLGDTEIKMEDPKEPNKTVNGNDYLWRELEKLGPIRKWPKGVEFPKGPTWPDSVTVLYGCSIPNEDLYFKNQPTCKFETDSTGSASANADPEHLTHSSSIVEPAKYEEMRRKIIEQHPDWPLASVDIALECDLETMAKCKEEILKEKSEEKPEN